MEEAQTKDGTVRRQEVDQTVIRIPLEGKKVEIPHVVAEMNVLVKEMLEQSPKIPPELSVHLVFGHPSI